MFSVTNNSVQIMLSPNKRVLFALNGLYILYYTSSALIPTLRPMGGTYVDLEGMER